MGKDRSERGAVLVEFTLVVFFVGIPMLIGGLFVFSDILAKTQATGDTPTAANFLAAGGCPTTTTTTAPTTTTEVICADGASPSSTCASKPIEENSGVMLDPASSPEAAATVATICEIDQIVGGSLFDTDPGSLQTAIYCSSPSFPTTPGVSGLLCAAPPGVSPGAVWACVRAWNGNAFTNIVGSSWINSESEQIVSPIPPGSTTSTTSTGTTTTAAGTTTTTAAPGPVYPALDFETFYPANTGTAPYNGTGDMSCGPPTTTTTGP